MKVLSIKQPWASLIVNGYKDVENRTWRTNYRGLLAIHASSRRDAVTHQDILDWYGFRVPDEMDTPLGGIIGTVVLADCVEHRHHSRWFQGPFGFVLKAPRRVPFLKHGGHLSIWPASDRIVHHCT